MSIINPRTATVGCEIIAAIYKCSQ